MDGPEAAGPHPRRNRLISWPTRNGAGRADAPSSASEPRGVGARAAAHPPGGGISSRVTRQLRPVATFSPSRRFKPRRLAQQVDLLLLAPPPPCRSGSSAMAPVPAQSGGRRCRDDTGRRPGRRSSAQEKSIVIRDWTDSPLTFCATAAQGKVSVRTVFDNNFFRFPPLIQKPLGSNGTRVNNSRNNAFGSATGLPADVAGVLQIRELLRPP